MSARLYRIDVPLRIFATAMVLAVSAVGSFGCGKYFVSARPTTSSTNQAPQFALPDADGNPFALSTLRGQKVLLVAWASW